MAKGSTGYSMGGSSSLGSYGAGKGYNIGAGLPKSSGYGIEQRLGGMKGYATNKGGSGTMYAVIGISYNGNQEEMVQGVSKYLSVLGQYFSSLSKDRMERLQKYSDLASVKGFYRPVNSENKNGLGLCEMCKAPVPEGFKRCPSCASFGDLY